MGGFPDDQIVVLEFKLCPHSVIRQRERGRTKTQRCCLQTSVCLFVVCYLLLLFFTFISVINSLLAASLSGPGDGIPLGTSK